MCPTFIILGGNEKRCRPDKTHSAVSDLGLQCLLQFLGLHLLQQHFFLNSSYYVGFNISIIVLLTHVKDTFSGCCGSCPNYKDCCDDSVEYSTLTNVESAHLYMKKK